ncbi:MAG: hypothetical protein Ct9H90mP13_04600 [Pseudomonadota bacterium]|nr:MAG: hypothetical protein Ct9H90mP13_04600 [Pseudomonadota bacterium]
MAIEKYSFTQSFLMSIEETNRMIGLTLNMLGKMVTGQISSDNLRDLLVLQKMLALLLREASLRHSLLWRS